MCIIINITFIIPNDNINNVKSKSSLKVRHAKKMNNERMDFDSISLLPFHLKNQKRNSKTNEKAMQRPLTCTSCESDIRKDIRQRFF